jgi:hypothetical protein
MFLDSTTRNFDKLAEEVVNQFLTNSVPLQEEIVKIAGRDSLMPEEVKRVVEKVNTLATIQLIKTAENGSLEFAMADTSKVLAETHPEGTSTNAAADTPSPLSKETMPVTAKVALDRANVFDEFFKPYTKTAAARPEKKRLTQVFTLQQRIDTLGRQKVAAELQFKKSTDKLLSEFSSLYGPDFTKFASEAFTIHGDTAKPLLEGLAGELRTQVALEKVAYCIDDINQTALSDFATAHQAVQTVYNTSVEIDETKDALAAAWADAKAN